MNFSNQQSTSNDQGTQFSGLREEDNSPPTTSTAELNSGGNTQLKIAESNLVPVASSSQRFSHDLRSVCLVEFLSRFSPYVLNSFFFFFCFNFLSFVLQTRDMEIFYSFLQMQSKYLAATAVPDLFQLCDNVQINVPNYSQNNLLLDMNLPILLGNRCTQIKQELSAPFEEQKDSIAQPKIGESKVGQLFIIYSVCFLLHCLSLSFYITYSDWVYLCFRKQISKFISG